MKIKKLHKRERFYLREESYLRRICNRINNLIPCTDDGEIMKIIHEMQCHNPEPFEFNIYWNRELYINCNFDSDRAWSLFIHTSLTEAVVSNDLKEHPGIVIRLKGTPV